MPVVAAKNGYFWLATICFELCSAFFHVNPYIQNQIQVCASGKNTFIELEILMSWVFNAMTEISVQSDLFSDPKPTGIGKIYF
jgi:hypothetical protein